MSGSPAAARPAPGLWLEAAGVWLARLARREWAGSWPHRLRLARVQPRGPACSPHDLRPGDPEAGARLLGGDWRFAGQALTLGHGGHPWDEPSPSRRFAVALHRFDWLRDLLAAGREGEVEALRLVLEWRRAFGRWNDFSWSAEVLERRVFNLACAVGPLARAAANDEGERLRVDLARQAAELLAKPGAWRRVERAAAGAVGAAALAGEPCEALLRRALARLEAELPATVRPDGAHLTRAPEAAAELLIDLRVLDDALHQRGWPTPPAVLGAIDRLTGAVRFTTLGDGRLAAFQGGGEGVASHVRAALADAAPAAPSPDGRGGLHRLESGRLQVVVDAAAPVAGPASLAACAQPAAIEVWADGAALIVASGWSPDAVAPQAVRLTDSASTLSLADASCGGPLGGFVGEVLGPRLVGAPDFVEAARQAAGGGIWLDLAHGGWAAAFGLRHERRLYLDIATDDLRGEDRLSPVAAGRPDRYLPFAARFHLDTEVGVELAEDGRVARLSRSGQPDWLLRTDAPEVRIEASVRYRDGEARRTRQVLLCGQAAPGEGGRIRWRLAPA